MPFGFSHRAAVWIAGLIVASLSTLLCVLVSALSAYALILRYAVLSILVCTLVMGSFFPDIPPDLKAAAMVDGCSWVGGLTQGGVKG